jgi:hypothetical protein
MNRTITLREFMFEELNRQLQRRGHDVEIVDERPKPQLATCEGENVVQLQSNQRSE